MRAGGRNFSSADGSLKLVATHTHSGCDALGEFEATVLAYEAGGPATPFEAEFRVYGPASFGAGAVVFEQRFPRGAEGTARLRLFPPCALISHAQGTSGGVATMPFAWRGPYKAPHHSGQAEP